MIHTFLASDVGYKMELQKPLNVSEVRDIIPTIAVRLGINSLGSLFSTCKALMAIGDDNGTWCQMLAIRFGVVWKKDEAEKVYVGLYYRDFTRCDELEENFGWYCPRGIFNYYLVTMDIPLIESDWSDTEVSFMRGSGIPSFLAWAHWLSPEDRLVEIYRQVKVPALSVGELVRMLDVPAHRRAVIRQAILRYAGISEPSQTCQAFKAMDALKKVRRVTYSLCEFFIYFVQGVETVTRICTFSDWLVLLNIQDVLEMDPLYRPHGRRARDATGDTVDPASYVVPGGIKYDWNATAEEMYEW